MWKTTWWQLLNVVDQQYCFVAGDSGKGVKTDGIINYIYVDQDISPQILVSQFEPYWKPVCTVLKDLKMFCMEKRQVFSIL